MQRILLAIAVLIGPTLPDPGTDTGPGGILGPNHGK